jgi:hypothetical protein
MKDILVSYTQQEKDEATENYIPLSIDKTWSRKRRYPPT